VKGNDHGKEAEKKSTTEDTENTEHKYMKIPVGFCPAAPISGYR
jgi:hypothetical protein